MKKFALLFLLPLFLFSCGGDEVDEQGYTSFIVTIDATPEFPNCVAAYKKEDKFYKLGNLGTLTKGKYSPEITVTKEDVTEVYIFTDYNSVIRFDDVYRIKNNTKNTIVIKYATKGIRVTDKSDPTQYPQ